MTNREIQQWNAPELQVASDTKHRARYRRLQSWYRETILKAPAGVGPHRSTPLGNMLRHDDIIESPGLNFLTDSISQYAHQRADEVLAAGGTLDKDRLFRNMLSSMPLCFNLFGFLRDHKTELATVLSRLLGLDVKTILEVDVEWAPSEAARYLNDRTAFDAYVRYQKGDGRPGLIAIETKYTEPFSPKPYCSERYLEITRNHHEVFKAGAEASLQGSATNQLWRNALLALAIQDRDEVECHSLVLYCSDDAVAGRSVGMFREQLVAGTAFFNAITYQSFVRECEELATLKPWAKEFERRYLNLTPTLGGPSDPNDLPVYPPNRSVWKAYDTNDLQQEGESASPVGSAEFRHGRWIIEPDWLKQAMAKKLRDGISLANPPWSWPRDDEQGEDGICFSSVDSLKGATPENFNKLFSSYQVICLDDGNSVVFC